MEVKVATKQALAAPLVWRVGYLEAANKDASKFLDEDQIEHLRQQIIDLATHENPRVSQTQNVERIEDFFELKDKGGILGKISVRVFFAVFDEDTLIVVLGCHKKESEGQTPRHVIVRVRNRLRQAKTAMLKSRKDR